MAPSIASLAASAPSASAYWISAMPLLFLVVLQAKHTSVSSSFSRHYLECHLLTRSAPGVCTRQHLAD